MTRAGVAGSVIWALLALGAAAIIARANYTADLSAFLPRRASATQRLLVEQLREGPAAHLIIVAIEGADAATRAQASIALAARLRSNPAFIGVNNGDATQLERDREFLFAHRYLLSADVTPQRFTVSGLHAAIGDSLDLLGSPEGVLLKPLFTRDPAAITETQILTAMLAIKGIYAPYGVQRLNHGIGFNTAAIELLLPTYGERLGLKGKVASHWALNPHPTLIPAIESGWVKQIHSFGSEVGMDDYIRARSDVFFTGPDGSLRSNRAFCQVAGLYACDMFIGSTLQIDLKGNSSTITTDRVAGFGGAPNMGSDARGRRHPSKPWLRAGKEADPDGPGALRRGRKLVVQIGETFGEKHVPLFVEHLDALTLAEKLDLDLAPVMVYSDDLTHIVTEEGVANLLLCRDADEREQAIRGVAGYTQVGRDRDASMVHRLRERGVIRRPEDLGIDPLDADRRLLAARSIKELVHWSGGLYAPPSMPALTRADRQRCSRSPSLAKLEASMPSAARSCSAPSWSSRAIRRLSSS